MTDLSALVARRLCHDFAGSVGAIATAVEMLDMADGPEVRSLLADSTAALMASLKLHRFVLSGGDAGDHRALFGAWAATRPGLDVVWGDLGDVSTPHAALLLGMAMTAAEAAPGAATLTIDIGAVEITAKRLTLDPQVADTLAGGEAQVPRAALAALLLHAAGRLGLRLSVEAGATQLRLATAPLR